MFLRKWGILCSTFAFLIITMKRVLFLSVILFLFSCSREQDGPVAINKSEAEDSAASAVFYVKLAEEAVTGDVSSVDFSVFGKCEATRTFPPAGRFEARHRKAGLHRWYTVTVTGSAVDTKAIASGSYDPRIELIEEVPKIQVKDYPFNDPRLPKQWHYINPGGQDQWAEGCDINAKNAWTIETGKPEVIVAINDMGVDYNHEDLYDNMWRNEAEINGLPGEDDDNNGFVDDFYGYSFMTTDGQHAIGKIEPGDHGTHVAGTVAAVNNNGIGVCGVAGGNGTPGSGVRMMSTQTLDGKNGALTANSFVYAADNGAVLINCSWGMVKNEQPTPKAVSEAIDYFNQYAGFDENGEQVGPMAGGLVIFAAGNDGREIEHPAMDENVFAVAALSANFVRSYFTSYGDWVDICAPGGDANRGTYVLSTIPENKYGNMQGSSMAAPHVTGVAALIVSHYGVGRKGFTRDDLIYLLQSTANKKALDENGSYANKLGAGLVDAYAALIAGDDTTPLPVTDFAATSKSNSIKMNWTIPGSTEVPAPPKFNVFYSKQTVPATVGADNLPAGVELAPVMTYGRTAGAAMEYTLTGLDFHTEYHLRIQSSSIKGLVSEVSSEITVTTGGNAKPVITPATSSSLTLKSHQKGELKFTISDPDGHPLSFTCSTMKGLVSTLDENVVTLSFDALKVQDNKTFTGTIEVSDSYDTSSLEFSFIVLPNTAPASSGSIEDMIFNGKTGSGTVELSNYFSDADGEELSYTIQSSTTSIIVKTDVNNGVLTVTPNSFGNATLTITASDARGAVAELPFRVLVRDGSAAVEAYPNPVSDYLMVRTGESGTVGVKIISSLGAVVFDQEVTSSPFDPAKLDLTSLSAGVYKVVFTIGSEKVENTLVKL